MAAEMEATTKLQTRGGKKPRKTAVRKGTDRICRRRYSSGDDIER